MPYLIARQESNIPSVNDVKASFSSWDSCMSKAYCKWPVIVAIIVVGLIALSLLFCLSRVLCCGAECACCCFRCCVGCCGTPRHRGHKHLDSAPPTPYQQQYRSHGPPVYGSGQPQFATFESSGKPVHEDSLPAMPSWEHAASRKIEVMEEAETHELDRLDPNKGVSTTSLSGAPTTVPARPIPTRNPPSNESLPRSPRLPPYDGVGRSASPYGYGAGAGAGGAQAAAYAPHGDSHSGYRGAAPQPGQMSGTIGGYSNLPSNQPFGNSASSGGGYGGGMGGGMGGGYNNSHAPYDTPASSIRNGGYGGYDSAEPTIPNVGRGRPQQGNNWRNL